MTTNRQLRDWLKGFPDDAIINIITTEEDRGHWERYVSAYVEPLDVPDVEISDLKGWEEFKHVSIDVKWDYEKGACIGVRSITLGKHYNE